jgi:hypothetical protein
MDRKLAKRIQQIDGVKKEGGEIKGKQECEMCLLSSNPAQLRNSPPKNF